VAGAAFQVGDRETTMEVEEDAHGWRLHGALLVPRPALWWPHTHGPQPLCECVLHLQVGAERHAIPCGRVGFRRLQVCQENGLAVQVNGVPVYCRGACWTVADVLTPGGAEETVARDLRLARDAGANLLRVGGTLGYENDFFYRQCDELGILAWQDFAFANMDYRVDDPAFAANIETEAAYQLSRLAAHPCLAVLCGNSEVEQQAAMRGVPRDAWRNAWFGKRLPELCAAACPDAGYVPSTPSGGTLPFHVREGVAHYYGVGAYRRSVAELRRDDVKFAAECLAFANVPESEALAALTGGGLPAVHDPRWKQRVPRDTGAGWDFDDVRDFYLQQLFAVDPVAARSCDMPRYLQLSRVATGEMMAQVFAEWRSGHSRNRGALVWFFKDLWPGAGWGILDSLGIPKAGYYYLRRSWQPRQITLTDEGLNGLHLHAINETAAPLDGFVELLLLKDAQTVVARGEVPCRLPPRSQRTLVADGLLGGFHDVTYAYRFGPPQHDVAVATLLDEQRRVLSEAFYFVEPRPPVILPAVQLEVQTERLEDGYRVSLCCDHLLQGVAFDVKGYLPDDNYFHLPPARRKVVRFTPRGSGGERFRATLEALNLKRSVEIRPKP
jgi:beta-mannosidase